MVFNFEWFRFTLKITVDGAEVSNAHEHMVRFDSSRTPELQKIDHKYGRPGDLVTISGKIFSKNIGPGASNLDNFDEIDTRSLQNIFFGSSVCELMNDLGNPYGVNLDVKSNGDFDTTGNITCKTTGSFVGPQNATLLVSEYGQSIISKDAFSVNSKGQAFFYHTLPEVSSVSPSQGSINGGTFITIEGAGFDSYEDNTKVFVNDAICEIVEIDAYKLVCKSPKESDVGPPTGGPRGLKYQLWEDKVAATSDLGAVVEGLNAAAALEFVVDQGFINENMAGEVSDFTGKLSGIFVAPVSGNFSFAVCSNDYAELYLGSTDDSSTKVLVANKDGACDKNTPVKADFSDKIELLEGDQYYIEAVHIHRDSVAGNKTNFLQISLNQFNTYLTSSDLSLATAESQAIYMKETRVLEKQKITVQGVSSAELTFTHHGIASKTPVFSDDVSSWKENLDQMFTWQCLKSQTTFKYLQGAEDKSVLLPGQGGNDFRQFGLNSEPFCGNSVWSKPWRIMWLNEEWDWLDARSTGKFMCFAAKGSAFYDGINVLYKFQTKTYQMWSAWVTVNVSISNDGSAWKYQCVNLLDGFLNDSPNWVKDNALSGGIISMQSVTLNFDSNPRKDGFLDEVSFGNKEVTLERISPAHLSNKIRMESIAVTEAGSGVEIEFNPFSCQNSNETFGLLGIAGATIEEMTTSATGADLVQEQVEYLKSNNIATFLVGSGKVIVERIEQESPAISGTFSVSRDGKTIENIPAGITWYRFQELLENKFGLLGVEGVNNFWDKCYSNALVWEFKNIGGDQPEITINSSNIVSLGSNLNAGGYTANDGKVMIKEIGGDFFRQQVESSSPIVTVWVNGFLSSCVGSGCQFSYDSALATTISAATSSFVDGKVMLTISGTGFTTDIEDFSIDVGGRTCKVESATATSVVCHLDNGPAGDLPITFYVKSKGLATGKVVFTLNLEVASISPNSGSVGGGTKLKITGTGFPNSMGGWANGSITIGGNNCLILSTSFSEIKCITPPEGSSSRKKRAAAEVLVNVNGKSASGGSYNYDASSTPTISSLSQTSSTAKGGDTLTISGSSFGFRSFQSKVNVGESECPVISWSATEISCILPPLGNGNHPVVVSTESNGYADNSLVSPVSVAFTLTGASPRVGSIQGGTKITITGSGFGNCSDVVFNVGNEHTCVVDPNECTDTSVVCKVTKTATNHKIWNTGRHFKFGPGYLWEPSVLTVRPGDQVQWNWNIPVKQEGTGISVHAVSSGLSSEWDGEGFKSGEKSSKGYLKHIFSTQGTFYYSTEDVIEGEKVFMSGKVIVQAPEDELAEITAIIGDISADTVSNNDPALLSSSCAAADNSCAVTPSSSDKIEFTFSNCITPEITNIEVSSNGVTHSNFGDLVGYGNSEITITGNGFGHEACQNQVLVGKTPCNILSSSSSSIICEVDSAKITSLEMLPISVNVENNGQALKSLASDTSGQLYVVPKLTEIASASGSWAGGAILTLKGVGLYPGDGIVIVNFGEAPYQQACNVVEKLANEISCIVPDYRGMKTGPNKTVSIEIYLSSNMIKPEVDTIVQMEYTFTDDLTPQSSTASPSTFSNSESIEVSGLGFGTDLSGVKVYLKPSGASLRRKRRSIKSIQDEIAANEINSLGLIPKSIHTFWKSLKSQTKKRSISWLSAGSSKAKRSADYLPSIEAHELNDPNEEAFHPLVPHLHVNTVKRNVDANFFNQALYNKLMDSDASYIVRHKKRSITSIRKKRSTEEELLEISMEGLTPATVLSVSDSRITFKAPSVPAGEYSIVIYISGSGHADATDTVITSQAAVDTISPSTGSIYGHQAVTISGNGFSGMIEDTTVMAGSSNCEVTAVNAGSVTCITLENAAGPVDFVVTSNGVTFPPVSFSFELSSTPVINQISPSTGSGTVSLVISGSNFGSAPSVSVGSVDCLVTSSTASTINCDLPAVPGGNYAVIVSNEEFGWSNQDITYSAILSMQSVSPVSGSFGGGSLITISGQGFDTINYPTVTVCNINCLVESVLDTKIQCLTPSMSGTGSKSCDLNIVQSQGSTTSSAITFTYEESLTPMVSSISPRRGGTGGGTPITITGSGFATSGNKVSIDGSICDITSESTTEIQCLTNSHDGSSETVVTVDVPSKGYGKPPDDDSTTFYYIDRWSSIWTWGGTGTPQEGELIVITEGQTILLDSSTPVLKMLLIDGGNLIFDGEQTALNLQAEYILIIRNGTLQIGTEDNRYLNEAQITLHGNVRCTELPIYGCKTIGVREGTLDLHGEFIPMTWTRLSQTAEIGDTIIHLQHGVNWKPGSEIVVATTGGRASMGESEKMTIESVSADGTMLTLTKPLKAQHLSISQTFGSHEVETRGEVGLLSRNIKIKGAVNQQFVTEIPACEKPFVANEEAEQSCFQGKFGEEIGTDEFGAIILIHAKEINKHLATARISYTEFNEVGQAFRVGRYPIHFHINGDVTGSYVRGNSIHHSYNRACTIHAVNNLIVEHNVAFDIKGLSFFIEDGIEINNVIQYNLAVYTRQSNSLLNPDIQPGAFWVVNPNNILNHNAVAGSTHFGFWYRVLQNPDGPSATPTYCPAKAPMGSFYNNSAHSNGLYGIWIFTAGESGWSPHDGDLEHGYCNGHATTATFGNFIAWNNEIGVEVVESGAIRFENMTLLDNEKSGIEMIHPVGVTRQNGEDYGAPTFKNSIVVAHSKLTEGWENGDTFCSKSGVWSGWWGNDVENIEFYNFDRPTCAALSNCARCKPNWAGGKTQTSGLSFINSPNKISWPWTMAGFYEDLDGTLCGTPGCKVVQKRAIYDPVTCVDDTDDEFSHIIGGGNGLDWLDLGLLKNETLKLDASVCDPSQQFHIVGLDKYAPTSLQFNDLIFFNEFGSAATPWRKKSPYKDGWAAVLPEGQVNYFFWNTLDHLTNITYRLGAFQMSADGDHLLLGHNFTQSPDVFTFNGEETNSSKSLAEIPTYETAGNTDWFWKNETKELSYILSYKDKNPITKRSGMPHEKYREVQFRVYRCLYDGCLPPPPPTVPPGRPTEFLKWSSESDWATLGMTKPTANDDGLVTEWISIPPGVWMVLDEVPPLLTRLYIYGVLEIDDSMDNVLSAEIIMIQGDLAQLVAGFVDAPHTHKFDILLRGNHETLDQPLPDGPNLGAKALGVFGKLQLHGLDVGRTWTRLSEDALAGATTITLAEDVDTTFWTTGAEIVIAPTGFEPTEVEVHTIQSANGRVLTLSKPLAYKHLGSEYSLDDGSVSWTISAEVGLLTRNIRIVGEDYPENEEEEFGARVLVSKFKQEGVEYKGYAKIANVEFHRAGQEGWTDRFDPRYSLSFLNHEDSTDDDVSNKESYVKKCSFNYNYNAAIGVFNSNNILLEDNVIYRTLEYGLRDEGVGNRWIHNFIAWTKYVGLHKDQRGNFYKRGCIILNEAWDTDFRNNAMAGCERAGLVATGHICSSEKRWEGNVIHSSHEGVHVNTYNPPIEIIEDKNCVVFRNLLLYKIYDYAFYLLTHDTVEMENNIIVDVGVGIHPFLIRPRPTSHLVEEKYLQINNTVFVGRSSAFDCETDVEPSYLWFDRDRNGGDTMWPGRDWKGYKTGHAGLLWPIFSGIGVPLGKPWVNGKPKSFPLLTGQVFLNDNVFANYNPGQCNGAFDSAIRTNPRGDDMQFPIISKGTRFVNVDQSSKIWMDRPLDKLVVNEHCVDMHCDGLKKALLIDTDGKIIGNDIPGTIIADSGYQWEGNPTAGLGYYRVPKSMVTEVNGDKIEFADKMPNTGIVRNDQCEWVPEWHAFKCHDINHRLLIMESMDVDTLDRRLSPVAVLANPGPNGFIDLINGPQDWSCCFGYACQKRISNFYAIVGTNMMYEIHLTSTPPIHMRYRLKHNIGGDPVLLKIFFPKPQRIDVFAGERYVAPENIDLTSEQFSMLPANDAFIPSLQSEVEGANYFDPTTGFLYLLLRGTNTVDYKIQPSVVTKIGATIDMDNFFEGDVAGNIAALLGIDPKNIRVTNIVREGSARRKRGIPENVVLEITIEPTPLQNLNDTAEISYVELKNIASTIANKFQDGSISAALKMNITKVEINEPIYVPSDEDILCPGSFPQDEDPMGECYFGPEENKLTGTPWSIASQLNATIRLKENLRLAELAVPVALKIMTEPSQAFEMAAFGVQPNLYTVDGAGKFISDLGMDSDPWIVTASKLSGDGDLINNVTCAFFKGYCEFKDLGIDTMGYNFTIQFEITYPIVAINPVSSEKIPVGRRPLSVKFTSIPSLQPQNTSFSATVGIWDDALDLPVDSNSAPKSAVSCTVELQPASELALEGTTTVNVVGE